MKNFIFCAVLIILNNGDFKFEPNFLLAFLGTKWKGTKLQSIKNT